MVPSPPLVLVLVLAALVASGCSAPAAPPGNKEPAPAAPTPPLFANGTQDLTLSFQKGMYGKNIDTPQNCFTVRGTSPAATALANRSRAQVVLTWDPENPFMEELDARAELREPPKPGQEPPAPQEVARIEGHSPLRLEFGPIAVSESVRLVVVLDANGPGDRDVALSQRVVAQYSLPYDEPPAPVVALARCA